MSINFPTRSRLTGISYDAAGPVAVARGPSR